MKRSEMEYKISEHLLQNEGISINARRLLKMLEREGMTPPAYFTQEQTDIINVSDSSSVAFMFGGKIYKIVRREGWEPEDEKK